MRIYENLILSVVQSAVQIKRLPEIALRQDIPTILKTLELMNDQYLTHAAVVLFGTKFTSDYSQCQLQMARFKGLDRSEFLDQDLAYHNVFELLESGMSFVRRHIPVAAPIEPGRLERVETPLIPFDAVREALINALCHTNYNLQGMALRLAIYDDRLEITNPGGLPFDVTLDQIKLGFSKRRNPTIAEVLFRTGLIEKWGRGIPKIFEQCKSAVTPEPQFAADHLEFKAIFKFPRSMNPNLMLGPEVALSQGVHLTNRQKQILEILSSSNGLKTKEIMAALADASPVRTIQHDLFILKKHGLIKSGGGSKTTLWSVNR